VKEIEVKYLMQRRYKNVTEAGKTIFTPIWPALHNGRAGRILSRREGGKRARFSRRRRGAAGGRILRLAIARKGGTA